MRKLVKHNNQYQTVHIQFNLPMSSQLSQLGSVPHSRKGCKYAKIPLATKIRLFRLVTEEGIPIKRISEKLQIKYSTAKTLVRQFKDQHISFDFTLLQNETSVVPSKKFSTLRAKYREICVSTAQNLAKDDEASEMNLTAINSIKETAEQHAVSQPKSVGRVEIVSKTLQQL